MKLSFSELQNLFAYEHFQDYSRCECVICMYVLKQTELLTVLLRILKWKLFARVDGIFVTVWLAAGQNFRIVHT